MRLDHVALATRDVTEPLRVLVGRLGGTALSGMADVGFRPMQVFMGDETGGMKIELLEPWEPERNDFLERFLTRHGDGPHHLTFKVDDLEVALDRVAAAGLEPVSVDLSHPEWREAFLMPRDAHGTVVQLADSSMSFGLPIDEYRRVRDEGVMTLAQWWPDPGPQAPDHARLHRVVLRVADVDAARTFFVGLLDGEPVAPGDDERLELEWPGGARLLLERVDATSPGIDRLELEGTPADDLVVAGTRLVVRPSIS